jgi:hypothetical protein
VATIRWFAVIALAIPVLACGPIDKPAEVSYEGVDFTLTCSPVEPDIVGRPIAIRTNVDHITASSDIITVDPHIAFAFQQHSGCGNRFDYAEDWFLAGSDELEARQLDRIVDQVAPFGR